MVETFGGPLIVRLRERLDERLHDMLCKRFGEILDIACFKYTLCQLGEWLV